MEVFLIPVEADRYELYCELPDDEPAAAPPPKGFFRGLLHRFREAIAEVERERHRPRGEPPVFAPGSGRWYLRVRRAVLCRIAETIAEQRLLWHLRRQTEAVAVHPEDLAPAAAMETVRGNLRADFEKHRFWVIIDGLLFILSGLLVVLPGPNVVGYYFGFRLVAHYLSMRGARRGLDEVHWHTRASAPLTELRSAIALGPDEREARVSDIAARLQLHRLSTFFRRIAAERVV
jgi:hypothetical protein